MQEEDPVIWCLTTIWILTLILMMMTTPWMMRLEVPDQERGREGNRQRDQAGLALIGISWGKICIIDTTICNIFSRVFGSMMGAGDDEDSLESDSDLILDGDNVDGEGTNDDDDDSDDDELEVNEMAAESLKNRKSAKVRNQAGNNSDDDF